MWLAAAPAAAAPDVRTARPVIGAALAALCPPGVEDPEALEQALPGFALTEVEDHGPPETWLRRQIRLVNGAADLALRITALRPGGVLRRLDIEVRGLADDRPLMLALVGGDCAILQARALTYLEERAQEVRVLAPDLETITRRELLDPPVPDGTDPGGITVAHVDSGVNYLLPEIAGRLARDAEGRLQGYDFWDLDDRPFDGDTGRSPFFPLRHGTEVASLLLREAAEVRLVPFRYPRPDMARMAALVAVAAESGAGIVLLPMGSTRQADWTAFAEAARAHPELLFIVSAGHNGRDIDAARPLYPAVLPLDNMIVVTSSDAGGLPAPGSNWGGTSVDLMVAAENQMVTGFDGAPTQGSGSSFAVPRVAALAARLKAVHPEWGADELKRAIFARAVAPPAGAGGAVAVGWIPDCFQFHSQLQRAAGTRCAGSQSGFIILSAGRLCRLSTGEPEWIPSASRSSGRPRLPRQSSSSSRSALSPCTPSRFS